MPSGQPGGGGQGPIQLHKSFASDFVGTESPISESGSWASNDANRTRINKSGGIAFGTQAGGSFDDSYAYVNGIWTPNVEIITVVAKGTTSGIQEVEHLHRVTDTGTSCVCYEVNFAHDGQYVDFVRWTGPATQLSDFVFLVPSLTYSMPGGAVLDGDRLRTTMVGNVLNAWIDRGAGWVAINSSPVTDTAGAGGGAVLTSGRPGVGYFKTAGSGAMNQYAFTYYQAAAL